jgi:ribonuclease PH
MAILDAGIPTKACLAASTIAVMQPFGMMLDPTLEEEQVRAQRFLSLFSFE